MAKSMMMTDMIAPALRSSGGQATLLTWFRQTARKLADSLAWYLTYRETAGELSSLSDRELDDIGVARVDIPVIAMQSANAKNRTS